MQKLNVMLVVLNNNSFAQAVQSLNLNNANLIAIVIENGGGKALTLGDKKVPLFPFALIQNLLDAGKNYLWLISGCVNNVGDLWKTKKFLMNRGVPEDNIINFEILSHISTAWFANLRYIVQNGADFFATGISYTKVGLDLNYIPHVNGRGVNLAGSNQDLLQGYLTAKYVFEHAKPGSIKFVLIGLAPYSFRYNNAEAFSVCSSNLQYMLAIDAPPKTAHDRLLNLLVGSNVKNIFFKTTGQKADLNFNALKNSCNEFPAKALIDWEAELNNLTKEYRPQVVAQNIQILKDYIKLCRGYGAEPVGVVFPFAPAMHDNYSKELLANFRSTLQQLEFTYIDLFDFKLGYECFYNMAHLNLRGAASTSTIISLKLYEKNLIAPENFVGMNYDYFNLLSKFLPKDNYNALMERVFVASEQMISRKDKIKVGFVLYDSAMWCGDDLYNFFAANPRFEPTIFLCLRNDKLNDELIRNEFWHGVEQFKSRKLNVTPLDNIDAEVPAQDVLILLTPYFEVLPKNFSLSKLTARTLLHYIPYSFQISRLDVGYTAIHHICRKLFFDSQYHVDLLKGKCRMGMPRGLYSGYPKLDFFFKSYTDYKFDWKKTRPNAKKIIWAPHWSIIGVGGVIYATFQWNYRFMYEFAKTHPEISWVVKPHPNLLFSAVTSGLFPSKEAFKEYLDAWEALPNAQVITGGYYQEIFATSDGMIHDSSSFIAEYQFTHKPMIYLTRAEQTFNDLGKAILDVSYLVDGQDLRSIAELMQAIFIEGNDPMFDERQNFFDKNLNYYKANGMTASEFIYKNIAQELED